jgi:hypothetical protein
MATIGISLFPNSFAQTQHYFEIWMGEKYAHAESSVTIHGNICPTPVPDFGTNSSIKVYGYTHKYYGDVNPTTYLLGENDTLPSCGVPSNIIVFQTRSAIDYAVSAVAQWTEKGKTITVQSGSTPIQILYNCIGNYNLLLNSPLLHPGGIASFKFHVSSFNCKDSSDSVTFAVYNYTGNVKSNILYQESKVVTGSDTQFNFTIPRWTDSNGLFHFLVGVNGSNPWYSNGGYGHPNDLYPLVSSDKPSNQSQNKSTSHLPLGTIRPPPPLKQLESGSDASQVACNQGFQLMLRNENWHPACVSQEMASKLIERNWGVILLRALPT